MVSKNILISAGDVFSMRLPTKHNLSAFCLLARCNWCYAKYFLLTKKYVLCLLPPNYALLVVIRDDGRGGFPIFYGAVVGGILQGRGVARWGR